jgi:hypothetical protein
LDNSGVPRKEEEVPYENCYELAHDGDFSLVLDFSEVRMESLVLPDDYVLLSLDLVSDLLIVLIN